MLRFWGSEFRAWKFVVVLGVPVGDINPALPIRRNIP